MEVNEKTVKYTRANLAEIINEVSVSKKVFAITKFGKKKAYIVPVETFEKQKDTLSNTDRIKEFRKIAGIWKNRPDFENLTSTQISKELRQKGETRAYDHD